jgi:hypothetical protein
MSPFYANYGYHPRTSWPIEAEAKNPGGKNYACWMISVHKLCNDALVRAREQMGEYYNSKGKRCTTLQTWRSSDIKWKKYQN